MSIIAIEAALIERLAALETDFPTQYENKAFEIPSTPYQRVFFLPGDTENPTLGGNPGFYRERGILQVSLMYLLNSGPGVALLKAQAIRDWFPRGLTLTKSGVTTFIEHTPSILRAGRADDRWVQPVRIRYYANIFPA